MCEPIGGSAMYLSFLYGDVDRLVRSYAIDCHFYLVDSFLDEIDQIDRLSPWMLMTKFHSFAGDRNGPLCSDHLDELIRLSAACSHIQCFIRINSAIDDPC